MQQKAYHAFGLVFDVNQFSHVFYVNNADKKIYSWQKIKNLKSSGIRDFMEIQWDSGFRPLLLQYRIIFKASVVAAYLLS